MPLGSPVLIAACAIDPASRGHLASLEELLKLPKLVTNIFHPKECDTFDLQVRNFQVDFSLPQPQESLGCIHDWWATVFDSGKYPLLSGMMMALLSCFHGPQVESAHNVMGDILDSRSHHSHKETYSDVQGVKYQLRSACKSAVQYSRSKDKLHDPVNHDLCNNLKGAHRGYKAAQTEWRAKQAKKSEKAGATVSKLTKNKAKKYTEKVAKRAQLSHQN